MPFRIKVVHRPLEPREWGQYLQRQPIFNCALAELIDAALKKRSRISTEYYVRDVEGENPSGATNFTNNKQQKGNNKMTKTQTNTLKGLTSFANNIGKLRVGRSTKFVREYEDGHKYTYAKITCDTVGRRPRLFTVSSDGFNMPSGSGYTYKRIMKNLFDNIR